MFLNDLMFNLNFHFNIISKYEGAIQTLYCEEITNNYIITFSQHQR